MSKLIINCLFNLINRRLCIMMCVRSKRLAAAVVAAAIMVGGAFAQETDSAYVPFVVNVDATVTARQGNVTLPMTVTGGEEKTLALPLPKSSSVWNAGGAQGMLKAPTVTGSRGNILLRLPTQSYQNADVSLYSVNGKRILRGKADAKDAVSSISRRNVAAGVYILSAKGINGSAFTTRLTHRGGKMNINVAFGTETLRQLGKSAAAGDWDITVSAVSYFDSAYVLGGLVKGTNPTQTITLRSPRPETPATPQPFNDITAVQLVANIKIGWNLGNTLDATDYGEGWLSPNSTISQMETAWDSPVTTKAMITAIKNAGFNTIRIPVSWTKASSGTPNYTIRADWMTRVVEVVNYAVENDMYIILNTHHDENVFTFMNSNAAAGQAAFKKIWEQIADTFKNYDEKLIFEGLNEPRTMGSANEWSGGTPEERNNLNAYYPIFVNAVRNSGGNNNRRILQINTYAASVEQSAIDGLTLPTDTVANKLVVSVHAYQPYPFCYIPDVGNQTTWSSSNPSDVAGVTGPIDRVYNKFVSNGIPVIIGEFYAMDKNNEAARAAWAEYYVDYAWKKGIKCVLWDNAVFGGESEQFGFYNRTANTFPFPQILTGLMNGITGTRVTINPNVYDAGDGQGSVAHGYQAKIPLSELLGSSIQVTSGDTFTLTYTFTSNVAIGNLQVVLIDAGPPSFYTELSGYENLGAVTVGTPVNSTKTITATATAGDSSDDANQFVFNIGENDSTASAPTLTFTALTLVKN